MNVFVQRMGGCDISDAVEFSEGIVEDAKRIQNRRTMSKPAARYLNLALAFLQTKFPVQCCGKSSKEVDDRCSDCPMRSYSYEGE